MRLGATILLVAIAATANAADPPTTWPPERSPHTGDSFAFAHFGDGHYNEGEGKVTMPALVEDVVAYAPACTASRSP
ncbi:MAG: hypothetical protein ACREQ9_13135 [Candidatus Binatia bacterium]